MRMQKFAIAAELVSTSLILQQSWRCRRPTMMSETGDVTVSRDLCGRSEWGNGAQLKRVRLVSFVGLVSNQRTASPPSKVVRRDVQMIYLNSTLERRTRDFIGL